ncbi:Group 3 secretory phospholipase A2 [Eumeta japonica]|uniref:phospholipase A2 n=1 Tax=Eumeta variegata TaxID=151549 RepID=A0A4C1VH13_EUMVA|nr:Group 3 secretory phospholipase A2 [Eumeta japonica]
MKRESGRRTSHRAPSDRDGGVALHRSECIQRACMALVKCEIRLCQLNWTAPAAPAAPAAARSLRDLRKYHSVEKIAVSVGKLAGKRSKATTLTTIRPPSELSHAALNTTDMTHARICCRFRACLKLADTSVSNMVGNLFFNVVQTKCFVLKPVKVCVQRSWWGKCLKKGYAKQAFLRDNLPY